MRVTVLELPARWGDPAGALHEIDELLAGGRATDLVLLPEASLSGYVSPAGDFDCTLHAEPIDGPTANGLADLARRHRTCVVGPLVLRESDGIKNAMVAFDANGAPVFTYRKRHPWVPEEWATPGREPLPVVQICDTSVTICICYDVHFVSRESRAALDVADLLLFPTAWVDDGPRDLRDALLRDLAQRHRIAIANANWSRGIVGIPGQGRSRILDAAGRELARAHDAGREHLGRMVRLDATLALRSRS